VAVVVDDDMFANALGLEADAALAIRANAGDTAKDSLP
jgi:hypothetical protein